MSERVLRWTTVTVALCGAAIATYLSYSRLTDTTIICPTSGCATVQHSPYAKLAGIPVAYLGVIGYTGIALAATVHGAGARRVTAGLSLAAAAMAAYLLVAQLALIDAVCTWCIASDCIVLTLVALAVIRLLVERGPGDRKPGRPRHLKW